MASLWLYCSCCPRFVLSAKRSPSICLHWVYKKLLRSFVTGIHALTVPSGVLRRLGSSEIYKAPWAPWIWLTSSSLTPGVNIFCANKYLPAQNEPSSSRVHCSLTSSSWPWLPGLSQASEQLVEGAARQEGRHLFPLSALTEPNQVLWAQWAPGKCSCLSGRLWSPRGRCQSVTAASQEGSSLPIPATKPGALKLHSWRYCCSYLLTNCFSEVVTGLS